MIEIGERKRQRKEGGGHKRGRHMVGKKQAAHCPSAQSHRGKNRGKIELSSLTDIQQEGRKTRAPRLSYTLK